MKKVLFIILSLFLCFGCRRQRDPNLPPDCDINATDVLAASLGGYASGYHGTPNYALNHIEERCRRAIAVKAIKNQNDFEVEKIRLEKEYLKIEREKLYRVSNKLKAVSDKLDNVSKKLENNKKIIFVLPKENENDVLNSEAKELILSEIYTVPSPNVFASQCNGEVVANDIEISCIYNNNKTSIYYCDNIIPCKVFETIDISNAPKELDNIIKNFGNPNKILKLKRGSRTLVWQWESGAKLALVLFSDRYFKIVETVDYINYKNKKAEENVKRIYRLNLDK